MSDTIPCARCGAARQLMRRPDGWDDSTWEKWQALEARFVCDPCEDRVFAWSYEVGAR